MCFSAPERPKLLLSTFLLAYLSPFPLMIPPSFHTRNCGNGTVVITAVGEG